MSKLECNFKTFLKSRVRYILVGGVLSALTLALIPNFAYATTDYSSDTINGIFSANIMGGCHFRTVNLNMANGASITPYLGDNFGLNESHMCGFGFGADDSFHWFDDTSAFTNEITFNNGIYTPDLYQSNSTYMRHWSQANATSDKGANTRNALRDFHLIFDNSLIITPSDSTETSVYMPFVIVYDNSAGDLGASGMLPVINAVASDIDIYKSNGDSLSNNDLQLAKNIFYNSVNSSLNLTCGSVSSNIPNSFTLENNHCYIYGSFLLNHEYKYYFNDIVFSPATNTTYQYSAGGNTFTETYRLNFLHYNDFDYKTSGDAYYTDYLELGYFRFYMKMCLTESECQTFANSYESQVQNRNNVSLGGFDNASGDTNLFMSWFDVFNFGFVFPFRTFFEAFSDSTNCVTIPIIGGMLHNPNAQYCSWWSNDIRSVLTPVFSLSSIMIITGLIIHWLKGYNGGETIKTKRGEK